MKWWEQYHGHSWHSEDDKIFLSYFTEQEFVNLIPVGLLINKQTKTTVKEALEIVKRWIDNGEWIYYDEVKIKKEIKYENTRRQT